MAQKPSVKQLQDGVLITLSKPNDNAVRTIRLRVVTDNIIHVQASPLDSVSTKQSLMAVAPTGAAPKWQFKQKKGQGIVSTSALNATVSLPTGEIVFTDAKGRVILQERKNGGKLFKPVVVEGEKLYEIEQVFDSPPTRGFMA
ncbi:DUF4968 domain-containing protein [Hymenobacter volaticus]|uniref:DUF4968 domain-containing protein n=1 Tax=Hymenobacter volaticus TaxID=2932254 RepID=A0ABY4GA08_9BACT|nr:DUF4968 domain-containing protein [Hymenobacter volaticus]UOQ67591.1 DUF4968 domain-containing protein [Hymenobacter volaticus]